VTARIALCIAAVAAGGAGVDVQARALQAAPTEAAAKPGRIRGTITAADTGRPLRRARVTVASTLESTGMPPLIASTNSSGHFEVNNVPPGSYRVSASLSGYLTIQYGQRRAREQGLPVQVRSEEPVAGIDLALPRGGVLAGRITDELGEPYPDVRVDALGLRYQMGRREPFPAGVATTDDVGEFRIAGLQPGSYHLVATSTETWLTEKKETYGYASTYFPGGPIEAAQVIALAASEQRTDLNFSLRSSRTARIRGHVQRAAGESAAGSGVSLAYSYPGVIMTAGIRTVKTAADGSFEFKDVAGGTYSISDGSTEQIITVADADIDNLVLLTKTGSTVSGTVVTDSDIPPPFQSSGVRVLLEAPLGKVLPTVRIIAVDTDWSFKLTNLGGPFLFRLGGAPPDWALLSVRLGDKDITDVPWDVPTGGKTLAGLKIVVTQKIGTVSGQVVDEKGRPTSAASIVIYSDDSDLWLPGSRFIRAARPSSDGRFSLAGLPAGAYCAIARDFVEDGQWDDRRFLEENRDSSSKFILEEGGTYTITLKRPSPK
jgi:hypothetical protein